MISAVQLYDYVHCPHRVALDAFEDTALRDEPNAFVELLWDHGVQHESNMLAALGVTANLRNTPVDAREGATLDAMARGEQLIFGGRLTEGDRVGEPDLLARDGCGAYVAGDIKSGGGLDGDAEVGKYKKHYAFQLGHYIDILNRKGFGSGGHKGFIVDGNGAQVSYDLARAQGVKNTVTWWESYSDASQDVRAILSEERETRPALASPCKLCHWQSRCKSALVASDDLTLIAELGRSKRDTLNTRVATVSDLAAADPTAFIQRKKTIFPGIGPDSLLKFHARAKLLSTPGAVPYLKAPITLPVAQKEVYFDIEADPMGGIVYLHGFVERLHGRPDTARFVPFFAGGNSEVDEEAVFRQAWDYLQVRKCDSSIYYYSKYERTAYKALAAKYPAVTTVEAVDELFSDPAMIDLLYDVVMKATEWPTFDRSIKTLAQYLGFQWRDTNPSGAASIEWYHRWLESGDPKTKQRILEYNEDDCFATGVLVDGIKKLCG